MFANLAGAYATRRQEIERALAALPIAAPLADENVQALPAPVQRWLQRSGAIGRPLIRGFVAVYDAVMFNSAEGRGLRGPSEQIDIVQPPRRLFFMASRMFGLKMQVLHDYEGSAASMQVRLARLFDVVNLRSDELAKTETVTFMNDLCFFAPSALATGAFSWREVDTANVEATFTNGPHHVTALLRFDARGDLVDFVSGDRGMMSKGGRLRAQRWSTPMREYREIDGRRVPTAGEAIWHLPEGDFVYGRFQVTSYRWF
jgi:hypothetical protein